MPQIGARSGIDPVDRYSGGAHRPKEIVAKLRRVDVLVSQGQSVAEAVRSIGVTQFTYYRWRKEFGGLKTDQMKQLRASTRSSATVIEYDHLNGEVFYGLAEARVVIEAWRVYYYTARPHSSLRYRPPAPKAIHWPSKRNGTSPPSSIGAVGGENSPRFAPPSMSWGP